MSEAKWTQSERDAAFKLAAVLCKNPDCLCTAAVDLAAQRNELRSALQYMYDSARELSCECFELGALSQARAALDKCR